MALFMTYLPFIFLYKRIKSQILYAGRLFYVNMKPAPHTMTSSC